MKEDGLCPQRRDDFRRASSPRHEELTAEQGFRLLIEILATTHALGGSEPTRRPPMIDRQALL